MLHAHEYSGAWSEKPEGPASGTAGASECLKATPCDYRREHGVHEESVQRCVKKLHDR